MNKNLLDRTWQFSDSVTLGDLLDFSVTAVKNLFSFDQNTQVFKFEHKDGEYIAKANSRLQSSDPLFEALYTDSFSTDFGISYVGTIQINSEENSVSILIPADKSYDPAGKADKIWVESRQINKLLVFVCVLITAARFGGGSKFIRRLYKVMRPIIEKYYEKKFLFRWMYLQVKLACLKFEQPPSYTEFINSHVKPDTKEYCENVELVKSGKIERVSIPEEYSIIMKEALGNDMENDELVEGEIDLIPQCFSPDIEEDEVPNVQEIQRDLKKVRERYESELKGWMKKANDLAGHKKLNVDNFSIEKAFKPQCPVF